MPIRLADIREMDPGSRGMTQEERPYALSFGGGVLG